MLQLTFLLSCIGLFSFVTSVPLRFLISDALGFQSAQPLQVSVFADSCDNEGVVSQQAIDSNPIRACLSTAEILMQPISDSQPKSPYPKALYFNVNHMPNEVASIKVNPDGTLSDGSTTLTEGNGASAIQAKINKPTSPDALLGTAPIIVVRDLVLVVNAGSNTVSTLKIDPSNPTELRLQGNPVDSRGDFPNHIVYSEHLQQVCVANSGHRAVISCYHISPETGLVPLDSPIPLPFHNQTTPPITIPLSGPNPESLAFVTSINFFPEERPTALIATIAGNPVAGIRGLLAVYPIVDGKVSSSPILNTPEGIKVPFTALHIPGTQSVLTTDAAFGAAIIDISNSNVATTKELTNIPNQNATCWAALIPNTNSAIAVEAFSHQVSELDLNTGAILQTLTINNGNLGNTEVLAVSDKLYMLSAGFADLATSIVVLDSSRGRGKLAQIQNFAVKGIGADPSAAGLAMWM